MSADESLLSVEEFLDLRFDQPEDGQWSELVAGRMVHCEPPGLEHGNTVLNLSKVLASHTTAASGYPCFDLGLLLQRQPATVWFPAACYFNTGPRFAETDRVVTETVPAAVIELASSPQRRQPLSARTQRYLAWGVPQVWIIDPGEQTVQAISREEDAPQAWSRAETVPQSVSFTGRPLAVGDLFTEPEWWA